jgi:streptogramin lyase
MRFFIDMPVRRQQNRWQVGDRHHAAAPESGRADLTTARLADFAQWLDTEFCVTDDSGSEVGLELVEVKSLPARRGALRPEPFSLTNRGSPDRLLPPDRSVNSHPKEEYRMYVRLSFMTALWLTMVIAFADTAAAGNINPGDLIVVDRGNGTLDDINPTTGALNFVIAAGFSNPQGVAINAMGTMFVSDIGTSTINAVNPTTGVVTTFSGNGIGTGPTLNRPFQMIFNASGTLYVADGQAPNGNSTNVLAIDAGGNRTLVVGNNGSSNNLFKQSLAGLALDSKGNIFVGTPTGGTIYQAGAGTATPLTTSVTAPQGLAVAANGMLLAINGSPSNPTIYSIDPTNGNTNPLSDNFGAGTGSPYNVLRGITVGPDGTIYATDVGNNEIFAVNPSNGDRSIVSGNGVGGITFGGLTYGIAVYPTTVPEPSSVVLLGMGIGGLLLYQRRRRSPRST